MYFACGECSPFALALNSNSQNGNIYVELQWHIHGNWCSTSVTVRVLVHQFQHRIVDIREFGMHDIKACNCKICFSGQQLNRKKNRLGGIFKKRNNIEDISAKKDGLEYLIVSGNRFT